LDPEIYQLLQGQIRDLADSESSPAVCREILLAMRHLEAEHANWTILKLAKKYDGKDRFYLEAIGIAVGRDPKRREIILADFDKEFPEWNQKVANLTWELRPPKSMARLQKLVQDPATPAEQRVKVVDIIAS